MKLNTLTTFKNKVISIVAIVFALVFITGFYAYNQLSMIVHTITNKSRPDLYLLTAKTLMVDVHDAENSVKSFSLTEDTNYIDDFYYSVENAEEKLGLLKELSDSNNLFQEVDSLTFLIDKKFLILQDLLNAKKIYRVQEALDKVVHKIEDAASQEEYYKKIQKKREEERNKILAERAKAKEQDEEISQLEEDKKPFLKRLFSKRKNRDDKDVVEQVSNDDKDIVDSKESVSEVATIDEKVLGKTISVGDVNKEVLQVRAEEKYIEEEIKQQELNLINADREVTIQINQMLDDLEIKELENIAKKKAYAESQMEKTNFKIAIFCVVTSLFLFIMIYIVINYIRHNNKFRRALKKATKEAENLAATKESFLANMSHEIRTPMNAIAGFTEQLEHTKLTKSQREQLQMVQKSVDHLLYLINDILDITKLHSGKLKLEDRPYKLSSVIEDLIQFSKPLTKEKNLLLEKEFKCDDDLVVIGDSFRFKQVMINLLSNAIKFTKEGYVKLTVEQKIRNEEYVTLLFTIEDTGVGMTAESLKKVFNEFEQADNSVSRNYGGTGLGLSIVKKILELKNGKIDIKSKLDEGTKITLEIPCRIGRIEDLKVENKEVHEYKIRENLKVLIVDDEEFNRKLLKTILVKHKAFLTEADDGTKAVEEIIENDYDLILMDARMPTMGGVEATREIRKMKHFLKSQVPIIALTAAISQTDKDKYKEVGMNGFVPKPFKESVLLGEICRVLKCEDLSNDNEVTSNKNGSNTDKIKVHVDFSELKMLSGDDNKFYLEMLKIFINNTDSGFKDVDDALFNEEWDMVADYSHKMCSPCRHLAADELAINLKNIENDCRKKKNLKSINDRIIHAKEQYEEVRKIVEREISSIMKTTN